MAAYCDDMAWQVDLHGDFGAEFRALEREVQDELLAHIALLEHFGPRLGRPRVDTLKGSKHPNTRELRFEPLTVSGVLPSPSIRPVRPYSYAAVTSLAGVNRGSIGR